MAHRHHVPNRARIVIHLDCSACRRRFALEGRRAWRAALGRIQGTSVICDSCADRAFSRAS
jgi:hypothetical protein